jgi:hypothetical protein
MQSLSADVFSLQFVKILVSVWLGEAVVYALLVYFRVSKTCSKRCHY